MNEFKRVTFLSFLGIKLHSSLLTELARFAYGTLRQSNIGKITSSFESARFADLREAQMPQSFVP